MHAFDLPIELVNACATTAVLLNRARRSGGLMLGLTDRFEFSRMHIVTSSCPSLSGGTLLASPAVLDQLAVLIERVPRCARCESRCMGRLLLDESFICIIRSGDNNLELGRACANWSATQMS